MKIERVNDFVVRFANVNGSGSASANDLFAKVIYRLGVPISPKNIFPSNIQGLPTWFEVRVNGKGYLGRRGGVDFMVAVNGQTMKHDYDMVQPGGYFLFDATRKLPEEFQRDDITVIDIPLTALCNAEFSDPRLRQLLKNIIYIGALASLLDIGLDAVSDSITRQFSKKPKLAEPNLRALEIGFHYAREHHPDSCALSIQPASAVGERIMMDGNTAAGLGALYAGATVAGWYPITPSTSVAEAFERFARRYRVDQESGKRNYAVIQARIYRHLGTGDLPDDRISWACLFCRDTHGTHQCPALRAKHRHAYQNPTGRHSCLGIRIAWGYAQHITVSKRSE